MTLLHLLIGSSGSEASRVTTLTASIEALFKSAEATPSEAMTAISYFCARMAHRTEPRDDEGFLEVLHETIEACMEALNEENGREVLDE